MPPKSPAKAAASRIAQAGKPKQRGGKGGAANRPSGKPSDLVEISGQAYELARLVQGQALDQDIAAILGPGHLPLMMQKILDNSLTGGPAAAQATGLIMRLLKHPAASAADKQSADRARPGQLRSMLVGRLTTEARASEGDSAISGRAGVTVAGEHGGKALPF
jgi:hypothetical protein